MVGSQGGLGDAQRPLVQGQRVGVPGPDRDRLTAKYPSVMATSGWSGPRATSVMRSARCSQGQRVGGPSQGAVGDGEVAQRDGRAGVVRSQDRLGDGQRPLQQRQRVGGPFQVVVGEGEVVQPEGRARVVGS